MPTRPKSSKSGDRFVPGPPARRAVGCRYPGGWLKELRNKNQRMRMLPSLQCPNSWLSKVPRTIKPESDLRENGLPPQQQDSSMTSLGGRRGTTNKDAGLNESEMHSRHRSSG